MRGIIFVLAILLLGCTQTEEVPANETPEIPENVSGEMNATDEIPDCSGPVCADGVQYDTDCDALIANASEYEMGPCPEPECSESDSGIDSKTAGYVEKGGERYEDSCIDESTLLEYTCLENEPVDATVPCEIGCEEGRCIEQEPEPEEPEPDLDCHGPVGYDIFEADSVTMNGTTYNDTCNDFTTVKDYYCQDNQLKSRNNQCPPGYRCNQGRCEELVTECTETDDGNDIFKRGKTTLSKGMLAAYDNWDECIDEGSLFEYYCDGLEVKKEETECGSGYMCVSGRCIESDCHDTDAGYDIYKKGTTILYDEEKEDNCIGDYRLREYFCYGNSIDYDDKSCPEGYICDGDRCTEGWITEVS